MLANFAFYFAELCKNTHFTEKRLFLCIQKLPKWGTCSLKNEGKSVFRDAKTFISRTFHRHTDYFWKIWLIFASKTTYHSETPHISTQNTIFSFDENDA